MLEQRLLAQDQPRPQQPQNHKEGQPDSFSKKTMEMEGQCKIQSIILLQLSPLKAILLGFMLTISIVGLLFLKYFKKLRASVFYNTLSEADAGRATHIFIQGQQSTQQISKIEKYRGQDQEKWIFKFKELRYELISSTWIPLAIHYVEQIGSYQNEQFMSRGLTRSEALERQKLYGKNEHKVEVPSYPSYLFDTMTQPLYLFQYFVSLVYALQSFYLFAFLMIFFGLVTTTVNYILLRRSYNEIKKTAEKQFKVKVLREGTYSEVLNIQLVPGDLYIPTEEIPCDSIVIRGEMFVDEVSLTGENVPIAKFKLIDEGKIYDKSHWLFQGSKLETMKEGTLGLVVNVGYGSRRGRIIRHILTKVSKQPQFFRKIIYFQVEVLLVSIVVFLVTLPRMFQFDIDPIMKILRFGDFITYSFPAPYPILFNLAYSFCLVRLNKAGVIGTQAQKTVEGSRLKTLCFDKTGTLTQNKMQVSSVYSIRSETAIDEITTRVNEYSQISDLFASCNSVEMIGREVKGDEIDLRLFEYVSARLQDSKSQEVVRELKVHGRTLQILRINQYQSQFQSMSVLVRQPLTKKLTIYVKGSPEMIHSFSHLKFRGFDDFVKRLSFGGYRSIAFGSKVIDESQLQRYLSIDRDLYLKGTSILGVVTFINKLKEDAASTLTALGAADISTKIITGDNIFLGIQTAFATGIIPQDKTVVVLEGSKYHASSKSADLLYLNRSESGQISQERKTVSPFEFPLYGQEVYAIDNDFIKVNPDGFLSDKVKVFARISPENKALIVRKHREREQALVAERKGLKALFGDCSFKVGMVGDGANDLIAIKEADLGIGISASDAIYSAAFAVKDLSQILGVVLESKNTERLINQMAKYYGITQFLSIVNTVILTEDCSYFTTYQLLYKNFVNTLLITLFFGTCRPLTKLKKFIPNSNFLDLENHLVFWGNLIITTLGLAVCYIYYSNTDDFVPNDTHRYVHFQDGWFGNTKSSTINFIAAILTYILLAFFIYQSKPWKKPIWTNRPLFIVLAVNTVLILVISATTDKLEDFQIQPIAFKELSIVYGIIGLTGAVAVCFNMILDKLCFRSRYVQQSELSQSLSLIEYA